MCYTRAVKALIGRNVLTLQFFVSITLFHIKKKKFSFLSKLKVSFSDHRKLYKYKLILSYLRQLKKRLSKPVLPKEPYWNHGLINLSIATSQCWSICLLIIHLYHTLASILDPLTFQTRNRRFYTNPDRTVGEIQNYYLLVLLSCIYEDPVLIPLRDTLKPHKITLKHNQIPKNKNEAIEKGIDDVITLQNPDFRPQIERISEMHHGRSRNSYKYIKSTFNNKQNQSTIGQLITRPFKSTN